MRYLITHLTIPNPVIGTAWESINTNKFKEEVICGGLELVGENAIIYDYDICKAAQAIGDDCLTKKIVFMANLKNVSISLVNEEETNLTSNIKNNLTDNIQ